MPVGRKFDARLKDREAALKRQKELLTRLGVQKKGAAKVEAAEQPPGTSQQPKNAAVRMHGDSILGLTVPDANGAQHLAPALRECVDRYLQVAQCGTREVVLMWPGSLKCLSLIHALATIEYWAQGYKQGLRAILYPATNQTFWGLNHVFADRDDVHTMTNELREVSFSGTNPAVKEGCENKDLMLFSLNSLKADAVAAGLQPSLNDLLPHFYLETGERTEVAALNYGATYLSNILSKLSRLGHAKYLREKTLPTLGASAVAPDAAFALSYKMTKAQLEQGLRTLKGLGRVNVILLDACRPAFERVERLQNRIATFVRLVVDVFGEKAPGILIVSSDPRQMTQLRAALNREEQSHHVQFNFGKTRALCHPTSSIGLQSTTTNEPVALSIANITVEVTDKESARLVINAYRLGREKRVPPALAEALSAVSKYVQTMANLPSAGVLLHKALDDSMADDGLRRRFDWIAQRNRLKSTLGELELSLRGRVLEWIEQANAILSAQEDGTPLARVMLDRIKVRARTGEKVLVVARNRFYADLANEYFLRDPESERLRDRVQFTAMRMFEEKLAVGDIARVLVCSLSPDLLRWAITCPTLPCPVDFLLTQETALGARHTLEPVLGYPQEFQAYLARVHAIYDPIKGSENIGNAVMPNFDYQPPVFTLTTGGTEGGGERGLADYVEIALEDGRRIQRGHKARVFLYDPAARESRAQGFRSVSAEDLQEGDQLFVMSEEMREQAEATFLAAGITFDEASRYEKLLRAYHAQVLERVRERFAGGVSEAARAIREAMHKANCPQEVGSIRYWINLEDAEATSFGELMPQAPRHFETFRVFMNVLGFDATSIQVFWDGAVKRVRGTRISDGLNLGEHYDRVLFDPDAAAVYDHLTPEVLGTLRANALDNVFEVTAISFCKGTPRG